MQEITVISGKGGTGKTSFTSAFASLAKESVFADCDVDAANLYLILQPENYREEKFLGASIAVINHDVCTGCGLCKEICRFDAIDLINGQYEVSEFSCEGCDFCVNVCPVDAITMKKSYASRWFIGNTRFGSMVHAKLGVAEDLSGKLVTTVREEAKKLAEIENKNILLVDGPPGIGCPVIASVTGTSQVIIVTEPTKSGIHDLIRVVEMAMGFDIIPKVIVNKFDINLRLADEIEEYCASNGIELLGKVPFDKIMVDAMVNQQTIIEYSPNHPISLKIKEIWNKIVD
ncbi:MAG: 4Fe-4S binding protein [Bacteroidota bacterium]|nr:4Fe-4S binding protein [Bacteroidota bacterium]